MPLTATEIFRTAKKVEIRHIVGFAVFAIALLTYGLTIEPTASYWDCPEYIVVAGKLENGHPPGNPLWTLVAHTASLFASSPATVAAWVNFSSALFSALTILLLYLTIRILLSYTKSFGENATTSLAAIGAMVFCWSDSFWFSAVEAEVYALSTFFTALMFWLMLLRNNSTDRGRRDRLLLLIAYLSGLTIGVHQLNLLTLPALALIAVVNYHKRFLPRALQAIVLSFLFIACLLFGMMPGTIALASLMELTAVNKMHLPMHSGVVAWVVITAVMALVAIFCCRRLSSRWWRAASLTVIFFCGGFFTFGGNLIVGVVGSAVAAIIIAFKLSRRNMLMVAWSLLFALLGFSVYALVLIRGIANPPVNTGNPDNIFALGDYISRQQYGDGAPLFYGPSHYSRILYQEKLTTDSTGKVIKAEYPNFAVKSEKPVYTFYSGEGPRKNGDSIIQPGTYVLSGKRCKYHNSPETDMFFPRIWNQAPEHREYYAAWAGADSASMTKVPQSFAIDSAGNPVGRYDVATGKRLCDTTYRPTQLQNMRLFFGYQIGFMYFRYLMWNYSGRQNDVICCGELDAGNFLTCIPAVDNIMLVDVDKMPDNLWKENPGRNRLFLIPFIIGIFGFAWQYGKSRRWSLIVLALFVMTGVAIVIYLNQATGEARDRDYSFLGSFYAYAIWIAFGIAGIINTLCGKIKRHAEKWRVGMLATSFLLPLWMLAVNLDDHNRAHRTVTTDLAVNTLESCPKGALLFTDGDNATFPLWYAQEIEKVRTDVRILNFAYMQAPWYINQLAIPTDGADAVAMTGTPADYAYNFYSYVRYTPNNKTQDAVEALKDLFRQGRENPDVTPRFKVGKLRLAPMPGSCDSIIIDLKKLSDTPTAIYQKRLAMLDIIATNAENGWPRAIVMTDGIEQDKRLGIYKYFKPHGSVATLSADSTAYMEVDAAVLTDFVTKKWRYPRFDKHPGMYVDYISASMLNDFRSNILWQANIVLANGDTLGALQIAREIEKRIPQSALDYSVGVKYENWVPEAGIIADIYEAAYLKTGDKSLKKRSDELRKHLKERGKQYADYFDAIPSWRRKAVKPMTTNEAMYYYDSVVFNQK